MKKMLERAIPFASGSGVIVLALLLISAQPAYSQASIPVRVTNTTVPVSGTVNVSSLPAVTLSGTPAVQITGTPTVQLSGTPAVSLSTTPTTPLFVDTDRPARNGFNASCYTGDVDNTYGQASCRLLTIPAGRQVVIESLSCQASLVAGDGPGDVQLILPNIPLGGGPVTNVSHLITLQKQVEVSTFAIWKTTTPFRAYASAPAGGSVGVGLFFRANYSPSSPQGITCAVSGYMVGQ
jgi:hypothetical protein